MIVYDRTHGGYLLAHEGTRGDPFDDPAAILVSLDYDYPGLASTFGWNIRTVPHPAMRSGRAYLACEHDGTDGTIDCPTCGTPASTFIESAVAWLDDNAGALADDPGYFEV